MLYNADTLRKLHLAKSLGAKNRLDGGKWNDYGGAYNS